MLLVASPSCSLGGEDAASGGDAKEGQAGAAEGAAGARAGVFGRIPALVRQVEPSVVAILVRGEQGSGEGSGVIWDTKGTVVTNNHVVEGAREVEVALASGERVPAEVRATDPRTDLAVLDVNRDGLPAARFAPGRPRVGELAIAMGNPLGFENTVTAGIVSGLDRAIPSGGQTPALVGLIQTDAAISPGNSGGALVGANGEVIGINVAYIPPQARAVSIGFAIPSSLASDVVRQLIETGEVEHPFLGVQLNALTPEISQRFGIETRDGAIVVAVGRGSPAAEAGIRPADVIVELGGRAVRVVEDVFAALRERGPGDRVLVTVLRQGERERIEVTLGERREPR